MLERRGFVCDWSFNYYCSVAHQTMEGLKETTYAAFPQLFEQEPNWRVLHREKTRTYEEILQAAAIRLMPGVEKLLSALEKANINRCVVTNSTKNQVHMIVAGQPVLGSIPHWVTREDYHEPKPSPEGYLRAITLYGKKNHTIIGFEDTIRGIRALVKTPAIPVLISSTYPKEFDTLLPQKIHYFPSFAAIPPETLFRI